MFRPMRIGFAWLLFALFPFTGLFARENPAVPAARFAAISGLIESNLKASGVQGEEQLAKYRQLFERNLTDVIEEVAGVRSDYRRARKLHLALHESVLRRYNPTADGLDAVLDRGEYNCVSATLLYGILARAVALDPKVVESPRHIFIRLHIDDRDVDIESTSPRGFDLRRDLEMFRRFVIAYKYATPEDLDRYGAEAIFEEFHGLGKPVTLERAAAFLWHNTGERALDRGEAPRAAGCFLEEFRLNQDLAFRSDRIGLYLARAFRMEYDDGRFDNAYDIAAIELQIFPGRTTARDRFLAAASKRIQAACEADDPETAEQILGTAGTTLTIPADLAKLERETCPRIAAAAVRADDWARARRMAELFATAEPDGVEATRFLSWVESRQIEGVSLALEEVCADPRHPGFASGGATYGIKPPGR